MVDDVEEVSLDDDVSLDDEECGGGGGPLARPVPDAASVDEVALLAAVPSVSLSALASWVSRLWNCFSSASAVDDVASVVDVLASVSEADRLVAAVDDAAESVLDDGGGPGGGPPARWVVPVLSSLESVSSLESDPVCSCERTDIRLDMAELSPVASTVDEVASVDELVELVVVAAESALVLWVVTDAARLCAT